MLRPALDDGAADGSTVRKVKESLRPRLTWSGRNVLPQHQTASAISPTARCPPAYSTAIQARYAKHGGLDVHLGTAIRTFKTPKKKERTPRIPNGSTGLLSAIRLAVTQDEISQRHLGLRHAPRMLCCGYGLD